MPVTKPEIILIGCGKMGRALLDTWLEHIPGYTFHVLDPSDISASLPPNIRHFKTPSEMTKEFAKASVIVLAVKPQIMEEVCTSIKPYLPTQTLVLSIAAGQTLKNFQTYLGKNQPVIRTMPNTPASIGKGMIVGISGKTVTPAHKEMAEQLFSAAGIFEWIADENLMNAVTAVSGSGPAYVFYMIETLAKAAEKAGLNKKISQTLARQTVIGSAALAEYDYATPPEILRENVTSPGGTTEAGLKILMDGRLEKIIWETVKAALKRGQELS